MRHGTATLTRHGTAVARPQPHVRAVRPISGASRRAVARVAWILRADARPLETCRGRARALLRSYRALVRPEAISGEAPHDATRRRRFVPSTRTASRVHASRLDHGSLRCMTCTSQTPLTRLGRRAYVEQSCSRSSKSVSWPSRLVYPSWHCEIFHSLVGQRRLTTEHFSAAALAPANSERNRAASASHASIAGRTAST